MSSSGSVVPLFQHEGQADVLAVTRRTSPGPGSVSLSASRVVIAMSRIELFKKPFDFGVACAPRSPVQIELFQEVFDFVGVGGRVGGVRIRRFRGVG